MNKELKKDLLIKLSLSDMSVPDAIKFVEKLDKRFIAKEELELMTDLHRQDTEKIMELYTSQQVLDIVNDLQKYEFPSTDTTGAEYIDVAEIRERLHE